MAPIPNTVTTAYTMSNNVTKAVAILCPKASAYQRKKLSSLVSKLSTSEVETIVDNADLSRKHGWLTTTEVFTKARSNPYDPWLLYNHPMIYKDSVELRDWVRKVFRYTTQTDDISDPRAYLVAWYVFQTKPFTRCVYIPKKDLHDRMVAQGYPDGPPDDAIEDSLTQPGYVTHTEFSKMQRNIRAMVKNSTALYPSLAGQLDLEGLDDVQKNTADGIVTTPFSCLQGGAGTGKSTLVAAIVAAVLDQGIQVVCLAPTHRAKKNLISRLPKGTVVSTIDSYLMQRKVSGGKCMMFVDESSMLSICKLASLAKSIIMTSEEWQVCLVGDVGQLEPIERGEMFRTALHQGGAHIFKLMKCYRSRAVDLYDAQVSIRSGKFPECSESVKIHLMVNDKRIRTMVRDFISKHSSSYQFISWTNSTCALVNSMVQDVVHGSECGGVIQVGDRVIYVGRNEPNIGLTNAMIGDVTQILNDDVKVDYEGDGVIKCALRDVSLAYCITVHKAQGSEFPNVCVVATDVSKMAASQDRRWLYTAVSRARDKCVLFTTSDIRSYTSRALKKREQVGVAFRS